MPLDYCDTGTQVLGMQLPPDIMQEVSEVISDYTLKRRIGVGGFGEVWQAIGPGGLEKAVKILHGRVQGRQADVELRSLERMKSVRHPFLLNIERIEVVDDRLIIVTELAEGSLEDRFQELRQQGHRGIPRDELLGYLRDAADAFDFLFEHHGLQHLDVKPANLLRQFNRIKVADFGLVKEVGHVSESPISGFTPLFAPPELFQGNPSRSSDQYSLAVVYQVLLTGEPPFAGRNAAQLVSQHLHSQPDLSPLAPSDRPVVAKALAKAPRTRFVTCREFVDHLCTRPLAVRGVSRQAGTRQDRESNATQESSADRPPNLFEANRRASNPSRPLAPLPSPPSAWTTRPALFVGIGGLGGQVLSELRQRLQQAFGSVELPVFPLLYIDTDHAAITAAQRRPQAPLLEREVFEINLRSPLEYREASSDLLSWLSRRWLYNMPRSGLVEGIRPLGRLAFIDHLPALRERMKRQIEEANLEASLRSARERTGLPLQSGPCDIYLVAAISGGTGSGAVLDAGYLARELTRDGGFGENSITGILLHTGFVRHPKTGKGGIETANTMACLQEWGYYSTSCYGYPGDGSGALGPQARGPFDDVYLQWCGSDDFKAQPPTRQIAEYLFRQVAARHRGLFEQHRLGDCGASGTEGTSNLRTFRVAASAKGETTPRPQDADRMAGMLIRKWLTDHSAACGTPELVSSETTSWSQALIHQLRLDADHLTALASVFFRGEQGRAVENFAQEILDEASRRASGSVTLDELLRHIDTELADGGSHRGTHPGRTLAETRRHLERWGTEAMELIQREWRRLLDLPGGRLARGHEAVRSLSDQLGRSIAGVATLAKGIDDDIQSLGQATQGRRIGACGPGVPSTMDLPQTRALLHRYCVLTLCAGVYRATIELVRALQQGLESLANSLQQTRAHLAFLEQSFAETGSSSAGQDSRLGASDWLRLQRLDHRIGAAGQSAQISRLNDNESRTALRDGIRTEALALLETEDLTRQMVASLVGAEGAGENLLLPRLHDVGGGHRVFAVLPELVRQGNLPARLTQQFGNCVTFEDGQDQPPFLCCEVGGIGLECVMQRLAELEPWAVDAAQRLHSRVDVNWRAGTTAAKSRDQRTTPPAS